MSQPLIYQQISKVMSEIDAIAKLNDNKAQGFKFRGIDDVYNMLHPKLAKHSIFSVPEVLEERREERPTKTGGVMTYVILKVKFTLFASDGSFVSAVLIGEGSDTGDKASNKAMSVAHKYFFIQIFSIPTNDPKDPDFDSPEFAPRAQSQSAAQATRPAAVAPKTVAPKVAPPVRSQALKSPGEFVITQANKEWHMKTIRQVVDSIGLPHFIKSVNWWAEESKRREWREIKDLKVAADAFEIELKNNHATATLVSMVSDPDDDGFSAPIAPDDGFWNVADQGYKR